MRSTEARVLRVISVVFWARWVAAVIWFVGCALHFKQMVTPYQPYGMFGGDAFVGSESLAAAMAALWLAWFVPAYRRSRSPDATGNVSAKALILGVHLFISWSLLMMGINCANALFDFSARRTVVVHVEDKHHIHHSDKNGGRGYSTTVATVTLVDGPGKRFEMDLPDCVLSPPAEPSPFLTVRVGRGALGQPWVADVACHPLQVSDRPLFDKFFLGHGQPAVLATVGFEGSGEPISDSHKWLLQGLNDLHADSDPWGQMTNVDRVVFHARNILSASDEARLSALFEPERAGRPLTAAVVEQARALVQATLNRDDPAYTLPRWLAAVQAAAPGIRIVWLHPVGERKAIPNMPCSTCMMVDITELDRDVASLFYERSADLGETNHIDVADGAGHRVFSAKLEELDRRPELIARLAAMRAK